MFVALLRACQPDIKKPLIREALDVLMPILVQGSADPAASGGGAVAASSGRLPMWVRYMKKVLTEESQSLPHLVHLWQLILRHPDLFYAARREFVPQMVNSLGRLGLPNNATPEQRRLSLDLSALIIQWEKRRQAQAAARVAEVATADVDGQPHMGAMLDLGGHLCTTEVHPPQNFMTP